jgi:hypothetical protein
VNKRIKELEDELKEINNRDEGKLEDFYRISEIHNQLKGLNKDE